MNFTKATLVVVFFLAVGIVSAAPIDLGLISVDSRSQAQKVSSIVDRAYARVGNQFVCPVTPQQISQLASLGVSCSVIQTDVDLARTYLVCRRPSRGFAAVDPRKLGPAYELESGVYISSLGTLAASSLDDNPDWFAYSFDQLDIPIRYAAAGTYDFLSQLDTYPSDSVALLVSQDSVYAYDARLQAFQTRYIFSDSIDAARDWLIQKYQSFGYTDVTTEEFWYEGEPHYNVRAVKQGWAEPDVVIVIGGHYDSIVYGQPRPPEEFAPGADDNGSGTALTLEVARILADIPLRKTVIFYAFSAEEVGLIGSYDAAYRFLDAGTDLEVMYNYDMVGYDPTSAWELSISAGQNTAYRDLTTATAERVTPLTAVPSLSPGSSDHAAFRNLGYTIVNNIETDFNYPGWHTELDLTENMNFPYLADVVRSAAASIVIVADAASPTRIDSVIDQGDGQSIALVWSPCKVTYDYTIHYGTSSGSYDQQISVPSGVCSYVVDGLTEGVPYFFSVVGTVGGSYPAVSAYEASGDSYVLPRVPGNFRAVPDYLQIVLSWTPNIEADLSHYRLYRKATGIGSYQLLKDNLTDTTYSDFDVTSQVSYSYIVLAVDTDLNESALSGEVEAIAATFDAGVLLVDEITSSWGVPDQAGQIEFFNSIFGTTPYHLYSVDGSEDSVTASLAGQFSSVILIDDEISTRKYINYSDDALEWYLGYTDNILVAGFRTIWAWYDPPLSGEVLYDHFGLSSFEGTSNAHEFAGAIGLNGWPSVEVDSTNVLDFLPYIPILHARSGAQVIYTYDSKNDDPAFEGRPCGLLYNSSGGIRVLLGFPLIHLDDGFAEALMAHALELFGEDVEVIIDNGDINQSGEVNVSDIVYLITYLFGHGPAPTEPDLADVNSSCTVNISDITYLVAYLFGIPPGAAPGPGCVP